MIQSELLTKLTEQNSHLYQHDIEQDVNATPGTISDTQAQDGRVELRGFGSFTVKRRDARAGRNPRTGEAVFVAAKVVPVFKTGKEMRHRLNPVSQERVKDSSKEGTNNVNGLVNAQSSRQLIHWP
jgi:integration host factor subunit beta